MVKGGYEFPEHYDADDISRTLAIGHMMLRKAKRREIIDARYATSHDVRFHDSYSKYAKS